MEDKKTEYNLEELKLKLAECEKIRDEYLDGWKRAKADFINYKKEEALRFSDFAKFANEEIIKELISVMDSFDLGLVMIKDDEHSRKGMVMIRNQFEDLLRKYGLEKIHVSIGENFNPSFHEAVAEAESDKPFQTVVEEIEKGYILNGKVIRPSRVKLSKG